MEVLTTIRIAIDMAGEIELQEELGVGLQRSQPGASVRLLNLIEDVRRLIDDYETKVGPTATRVQSRTKESFLGEPGVRHKPRDSGVVDDLGLDARADVDHARWGWDGDSEEVDRDV